MTVYKCLVNGSISDHHRTKVSDGLAKLTAARFGTDPAGVSVEFTEIDDGRWFTAGEPSSTTMVLGSVPPGTSQDLRAEHMDEVARFMAHTTGYDLDHIMVVAADDQDRT